MVILKLFHGLGPGFYHTARLWRKDVTWEFKTGFWTYAKYRRFIATINPPSYQKLSQNKFSEKAILHLSSIPSPEFIGYLHCRRGVSSAGDNLRNARDLRDLILRESGIDRICFKLLEGYGGQGFQAVKIIRNGDLWFRPLNTDKDVSIETFLTTTLQQGRDYIVEKYICQHPVLAALNPSSVNTVRVWVGHIRDEASVLDAFLRIGRRGSLVDNTSSGAQIFRLDIGSGVIGTGMTKSISNETFRCHKDTGYVITGIELPFWSAVLELATKAVTVFPGISFAGIDIAITESGPVVIELNVEPDPTSAIIFDRSHVELFSPFLSR